MKIGILGSGTVSQTLGGKLANVVHQLVLGSRELRKLLEWVAKAGPNACAATLVDAARHGEVVINATAGVVSLNALELAGPANLAGKILIDLSNPLDFSHGFPPTLTVVNTDSLGEQIQRALPEARVVKSLNSVNVGLMVNLRALAGGDHTIFVCGNDAEARAKVRAWRREWLGWEGIIDLGDITAARATEIYLLLWTRIMSALGTPMFSLKVVR